MISFVPQLPTFREFIFLWLLLTIVLIFVHSSIRIVVRVFNVANSITHKKDVVRTIVIGAGSMGKVVIDEARRNKNNHNQIVAFVDDDPNKIGGSLGNISIKGPISKIAEIIDYMKAEEVIIAMSKISKE